MAGHSHAKNVMRQKERTDKKRSALFSKLLKAVSIAARAEPNPDFNPTLRTAVEKARAANIPLDTINRAVSRGSDPDIALAEVIIEAYGPEGIAILITAITDNSNRTVHELKNLLSKYSAKPADPGSVLWAFIKQSDSGPWQAKFPCSVSEETQTKLRNLIAVLEDHDDVQAVYTNALFSQ